MKVRVYLILADFTQTQNINISEKKFNHLGSILTARLWWQL